MTPFTFVSKNSKKKGAAVGTFCETASKTPGREGPGGVFCGRREPRVVGLVGPLGFEPRTNRL